MCRSFTVSMHAALTPDLACYRVQHTIIYVRVLRGTSCVCSLPHTHVGIHNSRGPMLCCQTWCCNRSVCEWLCANSHRCTRSCSTHLNEREQNRAQLRAYPTQPKPQQQTNTKSLIALHAGEYYLGILWHQSLFATNRLATPTTPEVHQWP
jgi:hypothetical protein